MLEIEKDGLTLLLLDITGVKMSIRSIFSSALEFLRELGMVDVNSLDPFRLLRYPEFVLFKLYFTESLSSPYCSEETLFVGDM